MGGDLAILELWKSRHHRIEIPEILAAGPIVDGYPPLMTDFTLSVDSTF